MAPTEGASGGTTAAAETAGAWIEVTGRPRFALDPGRDRVVVGRDVSCDLVLPESQISRRHAELCRGASGWTVRDLGSSNGTWVEDMRIDGPTALRDGSRVRVGDVTFTLHHGAGNRSPAALRPRRPLRRAILVAVVVWVLGLGANAAGSFLSELEGAWLRWLAPNVLSLAVVVTGVVLTHLAREPLAASPAATGSSTTAGTGAAADRRRSAVPVVVVVILLVLAGAGAVALTAGVRYAVGVIATAGGPIVPQTERLERFRGEAGGSAGGVEVVVTRVVETEATTRVELRATNSGDAPVQLPLGPFCVLAGTGTTLESDGLASDWSPLVASGVAQSGTVVFDGLLGAEAQTATVVFSFGPGQPQVQVPLVARP